MHHSHTHTLVCIKQQLVPDEISLFFNIEEKYSLYDYLLIAAILNWNSLFFPFICLLGENYTTVTTVCVVRTRVSHRLLSSSMHTAEFLLAVHPSVYLRISTVYSKSMSIYFWSGLFSLFGLGLFKLRETSMLQHSVKDHENSPGAQNKASEEMVFLTDHWPPLGSTVRPDVSRVLKASISAHPR